MISKWLSASEIACVLGVSKRGFNLRAERDGKNWVCRAKKVRGGKQYIYAITTLPEDIQTAYAASLKVSLTELQGQLKPASVPEQKANISRYACRTAPKKDVRSMDKAPDAALHIAALRKKIVDAYNASGLKAKDFIAAYENGVILPDVRAELGKYGKLHTQSTFYSNWLNRYAIYGLAGLAPQYAARRGGSGASLDERAKDIIQALYLDSRKPSIASIERGIKQFGYELNYTIISRYIKNEIAEFAKVFYRKGEKAYHDRYAPYIERDYTLIKSMEWGCGDHHLFDFVITHEGRIFRPWLTMFIDMRSRAITGWHIDVVPNTLTIMRAFSMSVEKYGLFENMLVDNGKDFKSAWFAGRAWKEKRTKPEQKPLDLIEGVLRDCGTNAHFASLHHGQSKLTKGVLQDCGTEAHFATPYRGQSKPIERAFRTIIELFSKAQDTYVGSNTVDRPADTKLFWGKINGRERVEVSYTLAKLREDFSKFVTWFNSAWPHTGQGMNGKTPEAVFNANLEARREMPEAMRKYVFAIRERRVVQRNGICVDGVNYYNEEIIRLVGERVEVRRDINDIGKIAVFSLPDCVYQFDAINDFFKDRGIPEENLRKVRAAQKKAREHLSDFAKNAGDIRREIKTPAEILAEKTAGQEAIVFDDRKVAGGEPLAAIQKRRLRLPTDPD